jgi:formyl-CoA transferase
MSNYLISRQPPARYGNAHANIVPYEAFETADGSFILAVGNDSQFRQCCQIIARPELAIDDRFASNPARVHHRKALIDILQPIFRQKTSAEWVACFLEAGVPAGAIQDIPAVVADPQVQARGLVQSVPLEDGTLIDVLAPVMRLSDTPASIFRPPPFLGQHTDEVLREVLHLEVATISAYRQRQII